MPDIFDPDGVEPAFTAGFRPWVAYRMRLKRRRLLLRALRKRRQLRRVADRTGQIGRGDILLFATVRNELPRLPHFLAHYRALGVGHFLFVANDCSDGTAELLADQPDCSLWETGHSYKASRFGMDWLTWLMIRHGHGHWCVTADADELLVIPHHGQRNLHDLARHLEAQGRPAFGAIMLELYPDGPLGAQDFAPGDDPLSVLTHFDPGGFVAKWQPDLQNLLVRGGVRLRAFFAADPRRAPTLSKTPFVRWSRRYVYVSSTHSLLPPRLNRVRGRAAADAPTGVLLHTKFLPQIRARAVEEKARGEHFEKGALYGDYYDALAAGPCLMTPQSLRYEGWEQLEALGLMQRGAWQ